MLGRQSRNLKNNTIKATAPAQLGHPSWAVGQSGADSERWPRGTVCWPQRVSGGTF